MFTTFLYWVIFQKLIMIIASVSHLATRLSSKLNGALINHLGFVVFFVKLKLIKNNKWVLTSICGKYKCQTGLRVRESKQLDKMAFWSVCWQTLPWLMKISRLQQRNTSIGQIEFNRYYRSFISNYSSVWQRRPPLKKCHMMPAEWTVKLHMI